MGVIKLALVALSLAVVVVYLSSVNKEAAMLALIASTGIFLIFALDALSGVLKIYEDLANLGGISQKTIKTVVKITLLCYVAEFAVGLIEDFGLKSLSDKVSLISKILIVIAAAPIVEGLISAVSSLA